MSLRFYTFDLCPFCRPIKYFFKANNIPHDEKQIDLFKGEHKTEEYKKINPFQRVPAIDDDGYILFESSTLIRYLANSQPVADHWYPKPPKERAIVDLFFDWYSGNVGNLFKFNLTKLGYVKNITLDEAREISEKAFKELENVFLSQRKFIASNDNISVADVAVAFHFAGMVDSGFDFSSRLQEYIKTVYDKEPALHDDVKSYLKLRQDHLDKIQENNAKK